MVESIIRQDPSWAGYWLPAFAHCAGYFRVRDQATGVVIANISQSCNRAFASAVRVVADGGMDRLVIFGTGWDRSVSPWVGPCSAAATCAIDAFSSSDPSLAVWQAATPLLMPNGSTYNVGVVRVTVPQPGALAGAQWVMQTEGRAPTFFVCAGGDPAAPGCWTPLPADASTWYALADIMSSLALRIMLLLPLLPPPLLLLDLRGAKRAHPGMGTSFGLSFDPISPTAAATVGCF